MEEITQEKESEKNENEKETEEIKKKIIDFAVNDWGNEFTKIFSKLQLFELKRKTDVLYSKSGEKYVINTLWERNSDFKKDFVLEMEKEYPELKEMSEAIEESEKIMQNVYSFLEENNNKTSNQFWDKIHLFFNESKTQWEKFKENRDKLISIK